MKGNKYTFDEVKDILLSRGLFPKFTEYNRNNERIEMLTVEGYMVASTLKRILAGKYPSVFGRGNDHTAFNIQKYLELNNIKYKLIDIDVKNTRDYLNWECENGHKFKMPWYAFQNGKRCAECAGNKKKTVQQFKEQFYELAKGEYELLSDYKSDGEYVKVKHLVCGREYYVTPSHFIGGRRCRPCGRPRGKDNNKYNPLLTEDDRVKRRVSHGESIIEWRKSVYGRDNFTCKVCGVRGTNLNAHHLDGYNWCKEKRFDIGNGVTLCKKCHKEFHKTYGMGYNTREQFECFLDDATHQISISI